MKNCQLENYRKSNRFKFNNFHELADKLTFNVKVDFVEHLMLFSLSLSHILTNFIHCFDQMICAFSHSLFFFSCHTTLHDESHCSKYRERIKTKSST